MNECKGDCVIRTPECKPDCLGRDVKEGCKTCEGTGKIGHDSISDNIDIITEICPDCEGSGQLRTNHE